MMYQLQKANGDRLKLNKTQYQNAIASGRFFVSQRSKMLTVIRVGQKGVVPKGLPKAERRLKYGGTKKCQDFFDHGKLGHNPGRTIAREQTLM